MLIPFNVAHVHAFRANLLVLDNQVGSSCLENTDIPSLLSLIACSSSAWGGILWDFPYLHWCVNWCCHCIVQVVCFLSFCFFLGGGIVVFLKLYFWSFTGTVSASSIEDTITQQTPWPSHSYSLFVPVHWYFLNCRLRGCAGSIWASHPMFCHSLYFNQFGILSWSLSAAKRSFVDKEW